MKTLIATAGLTIMFLSAGAFAGSTHPMAPALISVSSQMTVINKNAAWPPAGNITVEVCKISRCIDI